MKINNVCFSIFRNMRYLFLLMSLLGVITSLIADEPSVGTKLAAIRVECEKVISGDNSAQRKSYAQLQIAQSYLKENKPESAIVEYEKIKTNTTYPDVHRHEADECIKEITRTMNGLPAHDPLATRTKIPAIKPALEYFVAADGSDTNRGTKEKPFATLGKARDAIRIRSSKATGLPTGGVAVTIMPGEYPLKETFSLTAEDGGTKLSPIVYRAEKKGAAIFYGGIRLAEFHPVTDANILSRLPEESRGHVFQCDLKAQGITDYGELKVRGFAQPPSPPTLELYFNGKPAMLARWPNKGFVKINKLIEPGVKGVKASVIEYDSPRHKRWTKAEDLWLFGYFKYLWADATIKIAKIDVTAKTLTTAEAYNYGGPMNSGQGIIYYAFNLLEEIDTPGEWYLDRVNGILYLWPPSDPTQATIEIGQLSVPMVTMNKVANIRLEGLTFDLARFNCMTIKDCENCIVAATTVKRFAGNGITITGGKQCGILSSDIYTIGRRAAEVIGGNRENLTPGGHFVENCRIYDFGRIDRTYTPAIQLEGAGNRVAHNEMSNCPSSVMRIEGNDHIIEYNVVRNAVQESDDQGGMELFGNPTYRGVIFRYNKFINNGKTGAENAVSGQAAIRFDDAISGMQIYGNIFYRSANGHFGAVHINSGRDNIIDNNLFADCTNGVTGGWNPGNAAWQQITTQTAPNEFYTNALYLSRYPAMANMMDKKGDNFIWRNIFYKCGRPFDKNYDSLGNSVFNISTGFLNAEKGDFTLKPNATIFDDIGFKPIPDAEIGLYDDIYRTSE